MSLITECPHCNQIIHLPESLIGRRIQCRRCLGAMVVGGEAKTPSEQRLGSWVGTVARRMAEVRTQLEPVGAQ